MVNPDNIVRGNVGMSSHYGFWYRALEHPDGLTGEELGPEKVSICPQKTPLGVFADNVAHSCGKFGLKMSTYFPAKGGASCTSPTYSEPAVFERLTAYKIAAFGIWGENLVDVHWDGLRLADYGFGGFEVRVPASRRWHCCSPNRARGIRADQFHQRAVCAISALDPQELDFYRQHDDLRRAAIEGGLPERL